jgi:fumarate reductase subunit C
MTGPFLRAQPSNWWAKPPYLAYTIRELTGVAAGLYAAILFCGLICLWLGKDSFNVYTRVLASPWAVGLHLFLLAAMVWHAITWFQILPKTMPRLVLGGRVVPQRAITLTATLLAACCSLIFVAAVLVGARQ